MDTFGDRLRVEREGRGLSIEAVARAVGVNDDRVRALERNDFRSLPDDAAMRPCLRAYAACLEVDAELMIEDYQRERERNLAQLDAAVAAQQARALPAPRTALDRQSTFSPGILVVTIAVIAVPVALWILSGVGARPTTDAPVAPTVDSRPAAPPIDAGGRGPASDTPPEASPRSIEPVAPASHLSIRDHGVGTGVEGRELVGRAELFPVGTQLSYWTRVEGGSAGDRIEHVWLRSGIEAARMTLDVGGPSWRVHSAKTLHAGSVGEWAVEARDGEGRVLARSEFACVP